MLRAGSLVGGADDDRAKVLERAPLDIGPPRRGEALVEPILGSWEANIDHALARRPIDVCSTRDEDTVLLGNLGVVRVLELGPAPRPGTVREGDVCLLMPFGVCDRYGYARLVHGYDAPHTLGLLARRSRMDTRLLLPIPGDTRHSLAQWATYGRYFTAWDNWHKALACWRSQLPHEDPEDHLVFAWGGGVALAELTLARRAGFRVAMTAASDERLGLLRANGIVAVDRREYPDLAMPARSSSTDPDLPVRHERSTRRFLDLIDHLSDGLGVAIFVDNIGEPLQRNTTQALARQGVVTTCGWKAGMRISHLRGAECINRHLHVNTHVWCLPDSPTIRDFQESEGWVPPDDATVVYPFDRVPELAGDYAAGRISSYFPLYAVNALP